VSTSSSEHFGSDLSLLKADALWCENKRCSDANPWPIDPKVSVLPTAPQRLDIRPTCILKSQVAIKIPSSFGKDNSRTFLWGFLQKLTCQLQRWVCLLKPCLKPCFHLESKKKLHGTSSSDLAYCYPVMYVSRQNFRLETASRQQKCCLDVASTFWCLASVSML